jgi:hypothetical protein
LEDLSTLCGAEERGAGLTFLRTGWDLSLMVLAALLCEERIAGCCWVCALCLVTEEDPDVFALLLRSASCLLTLLLLSALVLADGRCVTTRPLLPEAEPSVKDLDGLDAALLLSVPPF